VAADEALMLSGLLDYQASLSDEKLAEFNDRTGVYVGSPGNKFYQQYDFFPLLAQSSDLKEFADKLFDVVHPMWLLKILPNNVLAYTGIQYGFKGPNQNVTNHVTSGLQAVIEAYSAIQTGLCDRAVVVAYDQGFEGQAQMNYGKLGILSNNQLASFDASHDGTVLGEGAVALVLESEKSLLERDGQAFVEMTSGVVSSDAKGIFSVDESNEPLAQTLEKALSRANLKTDDLGLVVAHANGNPTSDKSEATVLSNVLKGQKTPITGFKWALGHTLAASGALDVAFTVKALHEKKAPGIKTFSAPIKEAEGLSLSNEVQAIEKDTALIINRGFAGMNAAITLTCG
jgi:3-oxoacyl-[acyl-carrier-protein] synthase-1